MQLGFYPAVIQVQLVRDMLTIWKIKFDIEEYLLAWENKNSCLPKWEILMFSWVLVFHKWEMFKKLA